MKNETSSEISYAFRWRPDFRYCTDKLIKVPCGNFVSTEPSVTDKEAYRITLASLRGEIAQGSGNPKVGSYSLKEGEEYNPDLDFSFLNRKDISIVELDDYMRIMRRKLEESDAELSEKIKAEIAKAENKKQTLEKDTVDKNESVE